MTDSPSSTLQRSNDDTESDSDDTAELERQITAARKTDPVVMTNQKTIPANYSHPAYQKVARLIILALEEASSKGEKRLARGLTQQFIDRINVEFPNVTIKPTTLRRAVKRYREDWTENNPSPKKQRISGITGNGNTEPIQWNRQQAYTYAVCKYNEEKKKYDDRRLPQGKLESIIKDINNSISGIEIKRSTLLDAVACHHRGEQKLPKTGRKNTHEELEQTLFNKITPNMSNTEALKIATEVNTRLGSTKPVDNQWIRNFCKRQRKRQKSILSRSNVLMMGMSYPIGDYEEGCNLVSGIHQAINCHKNKLGNLNDMDTRDLTRIRATEAACKVDVYTVSIQEAGSYRPDRHVYANYNLSRFVEKKLLPTFGPVKFKQIIMDYCWLGETGGSAWKINHWTYSLFSQTIPKLFGRLEKRCTSNAKLDTGVIYLPFCPHIVEGLLSVEHILKRLCTIQYVSRNDIYHNCLWDGTSKINDDMMRNDLGKTPDQEETYCRAKVSDFMQSRSFAAHLCQDELLRHVHQIKDMDQIRMVCLSKLVGDESGGYSF